MVYGWASRGRADPGTAFMNYGYASFEERATTGSTGGGEPDKYGMQLYDRVVSATPMQGKDVLE
ncbi:MAG: hypothetical protein ACXVVQ_07190, partial [Solirubrobacteraceae bacterium]